MSAKSPKTAEKIQAAVIEPISEDESNRDEQKSVVKPLSTGASRLFVPYRSLGVLSDEVPFYLLPHQSTSSSHLVLSIGDRFQMLQCDRLQPVLVSQVLPTAPKIVRLVSDSTLSITAVAHGTSFVTLYHRLKPLTSKKICSRGSRIVDLLNLGKMKMNMTGEKEGKIENAVILAAIVCKQKAGDDEDGKVPLVGEDDNLIDSEDESDDDDMSVDDFDTPGQVVIMIATRESLFVQKQCDLPIRPTTAIHPSTYVNKILVGGHDGLVLVNINSGKVIHQFKCIEAGDKVTALEQSPAVDTVAVGCESGKVHLINLRLDKRLFGLSHDSTVTSLSFRTDVSALRNEIAPLAVGRLDGTVSIWDLSPPSSDEDDDRANIGRTLLSEMIKLHPGGVSRLQYLPQEPVLVSTGKSSNSVLMHVFDNPDHSGRLWKSRKGHTSPPQCIRYLHPATNGLLAHSIDGTDAATCQILSGGSMDRTLRVFSSARSALDKEYSQGRGLEKQSKKLGLDSTAELLLPPITAFASSQARSRDWGDLVTIHQHHAMAYVWSSNRGAQSGPVLRQKNWNVSAMKAPPPKSAHATSVTVSSCGNYALVGSQGGTIYKYNIQSGLARGTYPPVEVGKKGKKQVLPGDIDRTFRALEKQFKVSNRKSNQDKEELDVVVEHQKEIRRAAKLRQASHQDAAVTGLAVDAVNRTLISVGADSKLILWSFTTHAPHKRSPYMLPAPATKLCHLRDSDLASIALQDFSVVLFDCSALQIVRRFGGGLQSHVGAITDMAFAPDGRSLYTASQDRTIRVWDVPTNHCVDWMAFKTAPTSITVSPTGEFLATTHADRLGICLWSDRTFYQTIFLDASKPLDEPIPMDDPVPIAESTSSGALAFVSAINETDRVDPVSEKEDQKLPPEPMEAGLVTLSGLPPAHWKNLFHLELVKERNKPQEAPKKPPTAPFFLQWRSGEEVGPPKAEEPKENSIDDKWESAWSDDDDEGGEIDVKVDEKKRAASKDAVSAQPNSKKRRVTHYRSHLASLLYECSLNDHDYQAVTDHMATMGPSAIDVALSTLCNGMHDLEEGLPLLHKASLWLLQACKSRERYEAVNAYLHRFLYLHANVIAGIEEESTNAEEKDEEKPMYEQERNELLLTISELRVVQASDGLKDKMQHSMCLLRHFLRLV